MLKIIISALLFSLSCASHAALTVVADLGGESTAPLFEAIARQMMRIVPQHRLFRWKVRCFRLFLPVCILVLSFPARYPFRG